MNWLKTAECRIGIGIIGVAWSLTIGTLDAVSETVNMNETFVLAVFGFSSGLISVGLWKKNKNNEGPKED